MATYYKKGKTFTVAFRFKGCPRAYLHGIKTEELARKAKRAKDAEEQLCRAGLRAADPQAERFAAAAGRTISEHIADFERDILARGRRKQHAHQQAAHCRRLFRSAKITAVGQITCEAVQRVLGRMLGPQCGPRTCNAARQAAIQFEGFLKRTGRVGRTVLADLERFNEKDDVRRKRRPLTQEEVDWLLTTTEAATDRTSRRCGIAPADRAILYATGIGTGYRQRALLSLSKPSFFVGQDVPAPFVRLSGKFSKNGKPRDQLIRADLAAWLRGWLEARPDAGPVWRPLPHARLALRFRRDLEAARAAWIEAAADPREKERREKSHALRYVYHDGTQNVFADFHGLRHTGITFVVRASGLRVGQAWADHSTPALTSGYAEVDRADLIGALSGLPTLPNRKAQRGAMLPACDTIRR